LQQSSKTSTSSLHPWQILLHCSEAKFTIKAVHTNTHTYQVAAAMKTASNDDGMVDIHAVLGRQVRRLRKEAGLSQDVVAEQCGLFRTYLSRIERGVANPTLSVLAALAKTLGVSVGELFYE
jgi:DNA-binding XRE family transcriptional regulator